MKKIKATKVKPIPRFLSQRERPRHILSEQPNSHPIRFCSFQVTVGAPGEKRGRGRYILFKEQLSYTALIFLPKCKPRYNIVSKYRNCDTQLITENDI